MTAMLIHLSRAPHRLGRWLFFARQMPPDMRHTQMPLAAKAAADNAQFDRFFQRFERQITAYLCRMTGDEHTALDLSQETFVRAWQHFADLQDAVAARAWLYRVATNLALRLLQQRQAHPSQELDDTVLGASDPGRRIVERDRVQRALMTLTLRQRSALILHEVQGLSCDEIGQLLKMSRDAVKMALWRGREQFRAAYLREEANT